jgi:hypothetical protein
MEPDHAQLDDLQGAYKAEVEQWIAAIKREEDLASVDHDVAKIDLWEQASFDEDAIRTRVKEAKKRYEDALREQIFGF